ncbi:MAG: hypothetical protein GF332_00835 [Candidatus Moranbacteria bacterium]|nr:hypothetical protein [Candidatus Moranbacteria bacterium]
MMTNNDQSLDEPKKKGLSLKSKIILIQLVLILAMGGGGYYYYYLNQNKIKKSENLIQMGEKLQKEKQRCSELISKRTGDFKQYDYCSEFLKQFSK